MLHIFKSVRSLLPVLAVLLLAGLAAADGPPGFVGVQIRKDPDRGLVVQLIIRGSPAEKAGLEANDQITKLDGKEYEVLSDFVQAVRDKKPGTTVTLSIVRNDKPMEIKVTVAEVPKDL
jgi:S1-C subfamily serine protease